MLFRSPALPTGLNSGELARPGGIFGIFSGKIAVGNFNADASLDLTIAGSKFGRVPLPPVPQDTRRVYGWSLKDDDNDRQADTLFEKELPQSITTSPVVSDSFIAYGAEHGIIYRFRYDGSLADSIQVSSSDTSAVVSLTLFQNPNMFLAVSSNGSIFISGLACSITLSEILSTPLQVTDRKSVV